MGFECLFAVLFLSTLSLRRATAGCGHVAGGQQISIHALLAESDWYPQPGRHLGSGFLSTLSLRRATLKNAITAVPQQISIHALLAESDSKNAAMGKPTLISIHALLAESDIDRA